MREFGSLCFGANTGADWFVHRPTLFPVPGFALKLAFGEFGQHMLDSARVVPAAAVNAGFQFRYPEAGGALGNLLG